MVALVYAVKHVNFSLYSTASNRKIYSTSLNSLLRWLTSLIIHTMHPCLVAVTLTMIWLTRAVNDMSNKMFLLSHAIIVCNSTKILKVWSNSLSNARISPWLSAHAR